MKLKDNYTIREIAGRKVMVPLSVLGGPAARIVSLSVSSAWLIEQLKDKNFTAESATDLVCGRYDVERGVAAGDVVNMLEELRNAGFLDD